MEEGCCICDVSDASNIDPLVYCDQCNLAVHKLCYGIEKIPEVFQGSKKTIFKLSAVKKIKQLSSDNFRALLKDDWFCNTCLYWKKKRSKDPLVDPDSKPIKCVLCDRKGGAMKGMRFLQIRDKASNVLIDKSSILTESQFDFFLIGLMRLDE